ncbi:Protein SERAC1, partial [Lachnellula suecica]
MGILQLYPENDHDIDANLDLNLDIIAIHGLKGDRERTWTEPKSHKLWLRDFLPHDIPRARIMVYGYDATPVLGASMAGIEEHARDLLGEMGKRRERGDEAQRPIIFIGHSLGGLVIKQALVTAHKEHRYAAIYNSTCGIIFFGTPHRGSNLAIYGSAVARVPTILANKPGAKLLKTLKKDSKALGTLSERFRAQHEVRAYEIVSFYETRAMKKLQTLVVEIASALLTPPGETPTWEHQIPVDATHRDMCRFSSAEDETYQTAVRCIKRIHMGSAAMNIVVENEFYIVPHSVNPHFTGRNDIRRQLSEALVGDGYGRSSRAQRKFVLYGLGGSGKTQMCLKFAEDHRKKFWGIFFIDASTSQMAEEGFMSIARTCKQEANMDSVKDWLSGKDDWLLIIDNADDPNLDISKFFPLGTKGTLLITTRNPDFQRYASAGSCRVDEMSPGDATNLLLKTAALQNIQDKEKETAEKVVKTLGYLALAIIQAGAVIRQRWSESSIDYQRSVYTTWEISIKMMENNKEAHARFALELLQRFCFMHYDGISESMFEAVHYHTTLFDEKKMLSQTLLMQLMPSKWDPLLMGKALGLLVAFSLITVDEKTRRISIHPLVHEWSRARMSDQERVQAWKTSVLTLSMATAFDSAIENVRQRKVLLPHIDAILSYGEDELFSDGSHLEGRVFAYWKFGIAYRENCRSNFKDLSERTLACVRENFPANWTHLYHGIDEVAKDLESAGNYKGALEIREELLENERNRDGREPSGIVRAAGALAKDYSFLGFHQKALELCEATISEFEGVLDVNNWYFITLWEALGVATIATGRHKSARMYLERGLEGYKKCAISEQALPPLELLRMLADVYDSLGLLKKARAIQNEYIAHLTKLHGVDDLRTVLAIAKGKELKTAGLSVHIWLQNRAKGVASTRKAYESHRNLQGKLDVATLA